MPKWRRKRFERERRAWRRFKVYESWNLRQKLDLLGDTIQIVREMLRSE